MKNSLQIIKEAGIQPKLRLGRKTPKGTVSTGAHRVKMVADKIIQAPHPKTGKMIDYVRYLVEENGESKTYQTKKLNDNGDVSYLVQRLAEIKENEEVILEMKKQGIKNYIEVSPVVGGESVEVEEDDEHYDDIPMEDIPE